MTTNQKYIQQYCYVNTQSSERNVCKGIITNKRNKHLMIRENDKKKKKKLLLNMKLEVK